MPSLRGVGLILAGGALIVTGRMFGLPELLYIGTGALAAVVLAMVAVGLGRAQVAVSRRVSPPRTHAGEQVQVDLEVHNRSPLPTSVLEVTDRIAGLPRPATFTSRAIPPGRRAHATYVLACRGRGVYKVGPLTVGVADPFGLARLNRRLPLHAELAVYPAVLPLTELPPASGHDVSNQADRPAFHTPQGDEFYTLRDYQVGDDLRKVHWKSTAKRNRLMIKQEQIPWHARGTVVLDSRRTAVGQSGSSPFEAAVVATASVVQYFAARSEFCRFGITDGTEVPTGCGLDHFRTIFGRLAVVEEAAVDRFATLVASLRRGEQGGGALVYCGGLLSDEEARRLAALRSRYSPVVVVRYPPSSAAGDAGREREAEREARLDSLLRAGGVLVVRPGAQDLSSAWEMTVGAARQLHGASRALRGGVPAQ